MLFRSPLPDSGRDRGTGAGLEILQDRLAGLNPGHEIRTRGVGAAERGTRQEGEHEEQEFLHDGSKSRRVGTIHKRRVDWKAPITISSRRRYGATSIEAACCHFILIPSQIVPKLMEIRPLHLLPEDLFVTLREVLKIIEVEENLRRRGMVCAQFGAVR